MPGENWTLEHLVALVNGGANDETNLTVTCCNCLPEKNAEDVAEKAKVASARQKHIGIRQPSKMQGRGFPQSPQAADKHQRTKDKITLPPRRSIYRSE